MIELCPISLYSGRSGAGTEEILCVDVIFFFGTDCESEGSWFRIVERVSMYHRWGVLAVVIDGVVSECENENYDCYSRMEYRSLPRNYVLSLTLS
jgi:hypothetical protein